MPAADFRFQIPADLNQLVHVRELVAAAAAALGAEAAAAEDVVLAVDESVTNIIEHGYHGAAGQVTITLRRAPAGLEIVLRDTAPAFDPTALPDPDVSRPLAERPVGGLGVYLVRRLMDAVTYRRVDQGGNELTLFKKLAGPAPAEGESP